MGLEGAMCISSGCYSTYDRTVLIPEDKSLWKLKRFREFLTAREELIREKLKKEFSI